MVTVSHNPYIGRLPGSLSDQLWRNLINAETPSMVLIEGEFPLNCFLTTALLSKRETRVSSVYTWTDDTAEGVMNAVVQKLVDYPIAGLSLVYKCSTSSSDRYLQTFLCTPRNVSSNIFYASPCCIGEAVSVFQRCGHGVGCMQLLVRPNFERVVALRADTLLDLVKKSCSSLVLG